MWQEARVFANDIQAKWVKTAANGRIIGRVSLKDGEYGASYIAINDGDSPATKVFLGYFLRLEEAQDAVDRKDELAEVVVAPAVDFGFAEVPVGRPAREVQG